MAQPSTTPISLESLQYSRIELSAEEEKVLQSDSSLFLTDQELEWVYSQFHILIKAGVTLIERWKNGSVNDLKKSLQCLKKKEGDDNRAFYRYAPYWQDYYPYYDIFQNLFNKIYRSIPYGSRSQMIHKYSLQNFEVLLLLAQQAIDRDLSIKLLQEYVHKLSSYKTYLGIQKKSFVLEWNQHWDTIRLPSQMNQLPPPNHSIDLQLLGLLFAAGGITVILAFLVFHAAFIYGVVGGVIAGAGLLSFVGGTGFFGVDCYRKSRAPAQEGPRASF